MTETDREHDDHPVDALLTSHLRSDVPPPPEVEQHLIERIETFVPPHHFRGKWPLPLASAIAAMLVIGLLVVLLVFNGTQQPLYAQVLAAMEKAAAIHCVSTEFKQDQPAVSRETWYQRNVGYYNKETCGDSQRIDIETRDAAWLYEPGSDIAARTAPYRSINDLGAFDLDDLVQVRRFFEHNPVRKPQRDKQSWTCYAMTADGFDYLVWLDTKQRVRQIEARDPKSNQLRFTCTAEYDVSVDAKLFAFSPPEGVRVVDPRQYLAEHYSVQDALFTREMAGMIFAVHELKRIDDKWALMVYSSRLTDENRQALANHDPWQYFGEVPIGPAWDRTTLMLKGGRDMQVASAKVGDLIVSWCLWGAYDEDRIEHCALEIHASAANELEQRLKQLDKPTTETFELDLPLPGAASGINLESWLRELHDEMRRLRPILHNASIFEVVPNPPKTNGKQEYRDPRTFTADQFIANIRQRLDHWPDKPWIAP